MRDEGGASTRPSPTGEEAGASGRPTGMAAVFGPTVNAIFAPARAYEALDARPVLALWPLLWTAAGMVLLGLWNLDTTRQIMRVAMLQGMVGQGQQPDAERTRQMIEGMDRLAPAWAIGGNLFILVGVLFIAVIVWMGSSLLGGRTNFARSVGVAGIGAVIHPLLATTFVTAMWKLNPPEIRRMEDMFEAMPSLGLDLLVRGGDTAPFVRALLARVDLFNLWWLALVVIGAEKLLGLKRGAAVALAGSIWLLTALVAAFWTSLGTG